MGDNPAENLVAISEDEPDTLSTLYVNGFEAHISLSDLHLTLMTNKRKHSKLLLSFTTAKTLLGQLKQAIDIIEKQTKQPILTMNEIKAGIEAGIKAAAKDKKTS